MMAGPGAQTETEEALAADLRLAVGRLARKLRQVQLGGLSSSQVSALASVERLGPVRLGDLAAAEGVTGPTLTKIVAHLETLGLVTRAADEADRRAARITLTAEGRERLVRIRSDRDAFLEQRLGALDPDARAALATALPLLRALADEGER
ncbi:MAG TPA: MarR family transcriptional regulator [Acidimicrobiales bacterium]|jgi:DNA-binding MarR family transcriptional regulator